MAWGVLKIGRSTPCLPTEKSVSRGHAYKFKYLIHPPPCHCDSRFSSPPSKIGNCLRLWPALTACSRLVAWCVDWCGHSCSSRTLKTTARAQFLRKFVILTCASNGYTYTGTPSASMFGHGGGGGDRDKGNSKGGQAGGDKLGKNSSGGFGSSKNKPAVPGEHAARDG